MLSEFPVVPWRKEAYALVRRASFSFPVKLGHGLKENGGAMLNQVASGPVPGQPAAPDSGSAAAGRVWKKSLARAIGQLRVSTQTLADIWGASPK